MERDGMSLKQVAAEMGISSERVRQIELSALEKLREMLKESKQDLLPDEN